MQKRVPTMIQLKATSAVILLCCVITIYCIFTWTRIINSSFLILQNENQHFGSCKGEHGSIESLFDLIQSWRKSDTDKCRHLYRDFTRIFSIDQDSGSIEIPKTFETKLRNTYHFSDALMVAMKLQNITKVFNKVTHDSNMFNPFREKRPITNTTAGDTAYVEKLTKETIKTCDLCNYKKYTAYDTFGRIISNYTYTMANAFKYDRWHSMVVYGHHHPHNWEKNMFLDGFNTAIKWLNTVHARAPEYIYPVIVWDLMPHASASQVHPHIHMSLTKDRFYGALEHWREVGKEYQHTNRGRNYFTDLLRIHDSLGLAVFHGSAAAFASITPKRDHEFVVLSPTPNEDFFTLLYFIVRTYIDRLNKFCFSMAMVFPPMNGTPTSGDTMPAFARIVTRGSVSEIRTDASSLELFAGSNVNVDPYKVVEQLKALMKDKRYL